MSTFPSLTLGTRTISVLTGNGALFGERPVPMRPAMMGTNWHRFWMPPTAQSLFGRIQLIAQPETKPGRKRRAIVQISIERSPAVNRWQSTFGAAMRPAPPFVPVLNMCSDMRKGRWRSRSAQSARRSIGQARAAGRITMAKLSYNFRCLVFRERRQPIA